VQQLPESHLINELARLNPKECLVADSRGELFESELKKLTHNIELQTQAIITERPAWYFDPYQARQRLLKHFGTNTLEGFGITDNDSDLIIPSGAVIEYLNETQKTALGHIQTLRVIKLRNFLQIDPVSLRSLEILQTIRSEARQGSLLHSLDATQTGMGGRMFRYWLCMPLCDVDAITRRQDCIEELKDRSEDLADMRQCLSGISDTERIAARVSTLRCSPRDLLALAGTLDKIPVLRGLAESFQSGRLTELAKQCDSMDDLTEILNAAIDPNCPTHMRDGGVIRSGFSEKLDHLRSIGKDGQSWLAAYQKEQLELTGIPNLRVGFNRVFGFYLEMSRAYSDKAPAHYVRKQTIKNAERYITDELKKYEVEALGAEEKALDLEVRLFEDVRQKTCDYVERLQKLADTVAQLDCLCCLAHVAYKRHYIRPLVNSSTELLIKEGKHPVLAEMLGSEFVANDVDLGRGDGDIAVITGPNMSGKSTYIRQTALLVLMAQTGSFIPASEATIGLTDRIFTRVGASDELIRGQSTFMVEMTETANIVNNATDRSLVILDEIGRGTSC